MLMSEHSGNEESIITAQFHAYKFTTQFSTITVIRCKNHLEEDWLFLFVRVLVVGGEGDVHLPLVVVKESWTSHLLRSFRVIILTQFTANLPRFEPIVLLELGTVSQTMSVSLNSIS